MQLEVLYGSSESVGIWSASTGACDQTGPRLELLFTIDHFLVKCLITYIKKSYRLHFNKAKKHWMCRCVQTSKLAGMVYHWEKVIFDISWPRTGCTIFRGIIWILVSKKNCLCGSIWCVSQVMKSCIFHRLHGHKVKMDTIGITKL